MKLFSLSLRLAAAGCALAWSLAVHAQLCEGAADESPVAPLDALIEEMVAQNIEFSEGDRLRLLSLVSSFGVEEVEWPTHGLAVQAAETIAPLVARGNMVAAEIGQLAFDEVALSWSMSTLRERVDRLLRTVYAPYHDGASAGADDVPAFQSPIVIESADDRELNAALTLALRELVRSAGSLGEVFNERPVRWILQGVAYSDPIAVEVSRRLICSEPRLLKYEHEVFNEVEDLRARLGAQ